MVFPLSCLQFSPSCLLVFHYRALYILVGAENYYSHIWGEVMVLPGKKIKQRSSDSSGEGQHNKRKLELDW